MLILIVFFLISLGFYLNAPETMDKTFMSANIILMLSALAYYIYYVRCNSPKALKQVHFRHSIFFIVGYLIVFYQRDIDYILGFLDDSEKYHMIWIDTTAVAKSLALSTMALISMFCGYSILLPFYDRKKETLRNILLRIKLEQQIEELDCSTDVKSNDERRAGNNSAYRPLNIKLLLYFAFIMLAVYVVVVDKTYLLGGYADAGENPPETAIIVMLQSTLIAIFAIVAYNFRSIDFAGRLSFVRYFSGPVLFVLFYVVIRLISGGRGAAMHVICLMAIAYLYSKHKYVDYKKLSLFLAVFIVLFTLIGIFRTDFASSSVKSGMEGLSEMQSFLPVTSELSNSVNTLHTAVAYFPDKLNYTYGVTFFVPFAMIVPGLHSFLRSHLLYDLPLDSDTIITKLALGTDDIYGMGSSCVADVYIAMGPIGVCVVFLIFGSFLRYLEIGTFVKKASPYFLVLSFCCYSHTISVCREAFSIMFLGITYALIQTFIFNIPFLHSKAAEKVVD